MCVCVCQALSSSASFTTHHSAKQYVCREKENQMHRQVRERESGPPDDSSAETRDQVTAHALLSSLRHHPLRLSLTPRNEISSQRVRYWHRVRMMRQGGRDSCREIRPLTQRTRLWTGMRIMRTGMMMMRMTGRKVGKKDWQSLSDGDEADNCYHVMQREERLIPCPTSSPDQRRPNDRELLTDSAGTVVSLTHTAQGRDEPESQCHCRRRG